MNGLPEANGPPAGTHLALTAGCRSALAPSSDLETGFLEVKVSFHAPHDLATDCALVAQPNDGTPLRGEQFV